MWIFKGYIYFCDFCALVEATKQTPENNGHVPKQCSLQTRSESDDRDSLINNNEGSKTLLSSST